MKTILFIDNTYPHAYQLSSLTEQAIGGTESSIINTAHILSRFYSVFVAQKYRNENHKESENLSFIPKKNINKLSPDYIVVLRKYPLLKNLHKHFPNAKLFLWIHTYKNSEYVFKRFGLARTNTTIICNSKTHALDTHALLNTKTIAPVLSLFTKETKVQYCYNPVKLPEVSGVKKELNKLLFFSSPNKGLDQVIKCFQHLVTSNSELKLYIANPGYKPDSEVKNSKNIVILGKLAHKEMMKNVKSSLCVFYPQDSFAETFGLIYAEANALGTPVLAHDIGAAKEVLHKNNELVNANDYRQISKTIKQWQEQPPKVEYNQKFSNDYILSQWNRLLKR